MLPNSPHGLVTSTRGQKPHPSLVVGDSCSYKRISRLWSDPMLARGLFRAAGSQNSALLWQRGARSLFCGFAAVKGRGDSLTVTITAFHPGAGDTEVCVSVGTDSPAVHPGRRSQVALTCPQPAPRLRDAGPILDSAGMHTGCESQKRTGLRVWGDPRPQKASWANV